MARSLQQLVHDYIWEPHISSDPQGEQHISNPHFTFSSNLIILFSHFPRSMQQLSVFMGVKEIGNEFPKAFFEIFGSVSNAFRARDIHFCWADVNSFFSGDDECFGLFERGIKDMGWGFCSTDAVLLGSAVVPLGLIWPNIACSVRFIDHYRAYVELVLEIKDVNRKPLHCKCCSLELIDLKPLGGRADLSQIWEVSNLRKEDSGQKNFWSNIGGGGSSVKIHVKEVWKKDQRIEIENSLRDFVLLHGFSSKVGKIERDTEKGNSPDFFPDKVLEMLRWEKSEFVSGKPVWQLLMLFLSMGSYRALVSVSDGNGNSFMGVLEPFTVHSAILGILDNGFTLGALHGISDNDLELQGNIEADHGDYSISVSPGAGRLIANTDNEIREIDDNISKSKLFPISQSASSRHELAGGRSKRSHKYPNEVLELTWNAFCKSVLHPSESETNTGTGMGLKDFYFYRGGNTSKKLRFLKCWMKQVRKLSAHQLFKLNEPKFQEVEEEKETQVVSSQQSSQSATVCEQETQPLLSSSQSVGENFYGDFISNDIVCCPENSESFTASLSQKIQQSLYDTEVDLGFLAERLVNSSIHWLEVQFEGREGVKDRVPGESGNTSDTMVATEMLKLILRKPKDLATKYKGCVSSCFGLQSAHSLTSDPSSAVYTSQNKAREYELQILFRMEILQSKISPNIDEIARDQMTKEICLLLEDIQFNLQGGIFGGEDLVEFAERAIKSRYAHTLGDVIHKIYTKMEFHSFDEDNVEHSRSAEENVGFSGQKCSFSAEEEKTRPLENSPERERSPVNWRANKAYEHRLAEAQKNRQRARRFAFFTSWVPDLQRVWVPKEAGKVTVKAKSRRKPAKTKKRQRISEDVVFETPAHKAKYKKSPCCSGVSKSLFGSHDGLRSAAHGGETEAHA